MRAPSAHRFLGHLVLFLRRVEPANMYFGAIRRCFRGNVDAPNYEASADLPRIDSLDDRHYLYFHENFPSH